MTESTKSSDRKQLLASLDLPSTVLCVDDDPAIQRLLVAAFSERCQVLTAENGREAIEIFHKEQPDFVVTDLHMPVLDGLGLIREARESFIGAAVPFLMLTSEGDEASLIEAFRAGVDDYLRKPFRRTELLLRVAAINFRQKRARDVNPLTRLPGNLMIKSEIERRLKSGEGCAIAYIDLDHFKAFNDSQGFDRGDLVIELMANILREFAINNNPTKTFVGHVGGDDFVVVLPIKDIKALHAKIDHDFRTATAPLYSPDEEEQGFYMAKNRKGEVERFELLSVSTGVMTTERASLTDMRSASQIAAEVKKQAKAIPGNSLFIDRRRD